VLGGLFPAPLDGLAVAVFSALPVFALDLIGMHDSRSCTVPELCFLHFLFLKASYMGSDDTSCPFARQNQPARAKQQRTEKADLAVREFSSPLCGKSIPEYNEKERAGVVQWQNGSFPSFGLGSIPIARSIKPTSGM
jgi:hypothetical protein